jgi:hypothetical protein
MGAVVVNRDSGHFWPIKDRDKQVQEEKQNRSAGAAGAQHEGQ